MGLKDFKEGVLYIKLDDGTYEPLGKLAEVSLESYMDTSKVFHFKNGVIIDVDYEEAE